MADSFKQFGLRMISGEDQSLAGKLGRIIASAIEPFYSGVMSVRNFCYDHGLFRSFDLGRPTISVGNITTGGTGKTPVVQWLAEQLRERGYHPAILLRGYGDGTFSDEAQLLQQAMNDIPVRANPSRIEGARQVLRDHPQVDVFILDDAFQHRKARRDFNLVLISATQPFGFGHVLPRGLLRESVNGLKRADAFLVTRCSLVSAAKLVEIDGHLKTNHAAISAFHADHRIAIEAVDGRRVFLTAGIGDPAAFAQQVAGLGYEVVGTRWFSDHHVFTRDEIESIEQSAKQAHADVVLTTDKDWVKIKTLAGDLKFGVVKLTIEFRGNDAVVLLDQITALKVFRKTKLHPFTDLVDHSKMK